MSIPGNASASQQVILVHDAAVDEYMSIVLLASLAPAVELLGTVIMDADCIGPFAMDTGWKLAQFLYPDPDNRPPQGLSAARAYLPFPWSYRETCIPQGQVEQLINLAPSPRPFPSGEDLLARLLQAQVSAGTQATLLVTGPLTPVQLTLQANPELAEGVQALIWMGGVLGSTEGNIDPATVIPAVFSQYSEWNSYCDPFAVDWIFRNTSFPFVMVPLNATNQAPIDPLLPRLKSQEKFSWTQLALASYQLVLSQPNYDLWDTLTIAVYAHPEFFEVNQAQLVVDTTFDHQALGRISEAIAPEAGRPVFVVTGFAPGGSNAFYDFYAGQLRR